MKHQKHERMAVAAFIITLAIAIIAFYYVYQQGRTQGQTIAGLRAYYCTSEKLSEEECADITFVQPESITCCCETQGGFALDTTTTVIKEANEFEQVQACQNRCEELATTFVDLGRCPFEMARPG